MSKLATVYANALGVQARKPKPLDKFYPLDAELYITVQNGTNQQAKMYSYFGEVLDVLAPIFAQNKIKIYQLGGKDDPPLRHCEHLQGKTSILQAHTILKNTLCHLGPDSWQAHAAGWLNRPLVACYGSTSVQNHSPKWMNENRTILLESHRNGRIPSYSQEWPKTVDQIPVEKVVNAVLQVLGSNARLNRQSLFFGQAYHQIVVEWVPDFTLDPNFLKGQPLTARFDYATNPDAEQILVNALQQRQLAIVANRPVNLDWVRALKQNILLLSYEITEKDSPQYIKELKQTGAKLRFFTKIVDEQQLSDLRLKYFDITVIEKFQFKAKQNFWEESERYLNFPLDKETTILSNLLYRSNKFILSQGKIYPSKAALMQNIPINSFEQNIAQVIDNDEFWREIDHFYIFKQ